VAFFPRRVKMLILIRKIGEFITIGDKIKIYVVDIQGKQIRLGIEAPSDAMVYRQEVYHRILEENRLAVQMAVADFDQGVKEKR
jgi:carbon storage regulator